MKAGLICILLSLASFAANSQNRFNLEIKGAKPNGGLVYLSFFNSETTYKKKEVFKDMKLNPSSANISVVLDLPDGEYFFSAYQDLNKNGNLDTNILGIPKEPVSISKYDGKGVPGGFSKHKVLVNKNSTGIQMQLYNL